MEKLIKISSKRRQVYEAVLLTIFAFFLMTLKFDYFEFGGSLTFGYALPFILLSLRWGPLTAALPASLLGFLMAFFLSKDMFSISIISEYVISLALLSFAGFFTGQKKIGVLKVIFSSVFAVFFRFFYLVITANVFFSEYLAGDDKIYSAIVNNLSILIDGFFSVTILLIIYALYKQKVFVYQK